MGDRVPNKKAVQFEGKGLKDAFIIVWLIITLLTFATVLSVFVLKKDTVLATAPICVYQKELGTACFMCGTTRAFTLIKEGEFSEAYQLNKSSIFLYLLFILNFISFLAFIILTRANPFFKMKKDS